MAVGLYVQGIYRKSPGASSKRAVKATLEEGIDRHVYVHVVDFASRYLVCLVNVVACVFMCTWPSYSNL